MASNGFSEKVSCIWSVADLLRGPHKPNQYGRIILRLTVLRRLDCVLEPTKEKVLAKDAAIKLPAPIKKAILARFSQRDTSADVCTDKDGNPEPDTDLRDYENVPLKEDIYEYFAREVTPHLPDAWINEEKRDEKDGEVGIVGYEIPLTRHFYEYKPPRPLEVCAGAFLSKQFLAYFEPILTGVSVPHISPEQIGAFRVFVPDIDLQKANAKQTFAEIRSLDELECRILDGIAKLNEYRSALISAAVTDKIDVRAA